jgi:hypothetical protein
MTPPSYENMVLLPTVDNILYNLQRQGKISFYVSLSVQLVLHQLNMT